VTLRYLSVCSGIEAASVAWHPLSWEPAAFAEIDPFPSAVLAHHYPQVPNHGDFTTIQAEQLGGAVDLLVGGTPCQSFSVAGLRRGLADDRGNLALQFALLAERVRPRWVLWENVPGVLSSNGGRDFGSILGALEQLGYGWAYRVLDAQYFGVPQRRRRVFVVGCLGDFRRAAAVLFERHSLQGHPAPRREAGEGIAGTFKACAGSGGWSNSADHAAAGYMIPAPNAVGFECGPQSGGFIDVAPTLDTRCKDGPIRNQLGAGVLARCLTTGEGNRQDAETTTLVPIPMDTTNITSAANRSNPRPGDPCHPLAAGAHPPAVAFTQDSSPVASNDLSPSLKIGTGLDIGQPPCIHHAAAVRRLTPRECERLQGFPDDYTLVPYRGKPAADGPRYKALGNSMAVPVMRWIGERIQAVESLPTHPDSVPSPRHQHRTSQP